MHHLKNITLAALLAAVALVACGPQKVAPENRGQRNDSCDAKNDCGDGLSCLSGRCQPTNFKLDPAANECTIFECEADADCCGDRPATAPAECNGRDSICEQPSIPGCLSTSCESDAECGGGTCGDGYCADEGIFSDCDTDADCTPTENVCNLITDLCSETGDDCSAEACPAVPNTNTCVSRSCDCSNPDYDPTAEICDNPDCEDLCTKVCDLETNLCVDDTSCETDSDCFGLGLTICTEEGSCIECESTEDCDEDNQEECTAEGLCERPCEFDQECGAFQACQAGECVFVGCQSNLDCVLDSDAIVGAFSTDGRLAECVTGAGADGLNECLFPCENDGHCDEMSVCDGGFCKELGCETNAQCDRKLNLQNQVVSDARPYVSEGRCVDPTTGNPVEGPAPSAPAAE